MPRVLLLGAGCSRGTVGESAPMSDEFGAAFNRINPDWPDEFPNLARVISVIQERTPRVSRDSWGLDVVWSAIDNHAKLRDIEEGELSPRMSSKYGLKDCPKGWDAWQLGGIELRKAHAQVYGGLGNGIVYGNPDQPGSLIEEIKQLKSTDCVASFNYDLLAERILSSLRINYWTPGVTHSASGSLVLCKPHGSLDWRHTIPESAASVPIRFLPHALSPAEVGCRGGYNIQALIVEPKPFKEQLLIRELSESVPRAYQLLVEQWKCLLRHIGSADELVVMGYGFPKEDVYGEYLFTTLRPRTKKRLRVKIYERTGQEGRVVDRLRELFSPLSIKCVGEVRRPDG